MVELDGSVNVRVNLFEKPKIEWEYDWKCDAVVVKMGVWPYTYEILLFRNAAQHLYEALGQALTERENVTAETVHLPTVPDGVTG